jgi:hypothetical protein
MPNALALNKEAEWAITCASHVFKWMPDYDNLTRHPEPTSVLTERTLNSLKPGEWQKMVGWGGS